MVTGMSHKVFKIVAILGMVFSVALGLSCHVHASPHTHGIPSSDHHDHHDETSSSMIDDLACIAAVIPSIDQLLALSAFRHDVSFSAEKPSVPVFELYIPPRSSL